LCEGDLKYLRHYAINNLTKISDNSDEKFVVAMDVSHNIDMEISKINSFLGVQYDVQKHKNST
jgi:hypothetical protein